MDASQIPVPRRNAAKRAAEKVAEQLSSSESDEEAITNPPTGKQGGWRGRKPGKETSKAEKALPQSRLYVQDELEVVASGNPEEAAALQPTTMGPSTSQSTRPKPRPVVRKKQPSTPKKATVATPVTPIGRLMDGDDSDLTPLPTPAKSSAKPKPRRSSPAKKPSVKVTTTISASPSTINVSLRDHPMFASTSTSNSLTTRLNLLVKPSRVNNDEGWSLDGLGKFVWVLLNGKNSKSADVYNAERDGGESAEQLWWPGLVQGKPTKNVLKVKLFGNSAKTVHLKPPSSINVLSRLDTLSFLRFNSYEAAFTSSIESQSTLGVQASPRKKQKLSNDPETLWKEAVEQMQEKVDAEADENDSDLPDVAEALSSSFFAISHLVRTRSVPNLRQNSKNAVGKGTGKGKRKYHSDSEDHDLSGVDGDDVDWGPPASHGDLEIPGELLLARVSKTSLTEYWPALLMEYIPPKGRDKEGKYKVEFFDKTKDTIPRSLFYITEEDGFGTCKLGEIESTVKDNDDDDDDQDQGALSRGPSPLPSGLPPSKEEFSNLSVREQFVHTKGVLRAILNNEYEPVKEKQRVFMAGGKAKENLTSMAGSRGLMDPRHVNEVSRYINHWCLRSELRVVELVIGAEAAEADSNMIDLTDETDVDTQEGKKEDASMASGEQGLAEERLFSPASTEPIVFSSPSEPPSSSFSPLGSDISTQRAQSVDSLPSLEASIASLSNGPPATESGYSSFTEAKEDDVQGTFSPPKQEPGCEAYEALRPLQKIEYCTNILLPEAVRQILLWRSGDRNSVELLSPEEEGVLYEKGQELLEKRDWVYDVQRIRKLKEGAVKKKKNAVTGWDGVMLDRRESNRSTRNRKVVNYQE